MTWFTAVTTYLILWWLALFVVLPIGVKPDSEGDPAAGGWRGAPERPMLMKKALITTLLAAALWAVAFWLMETDLISFRHGPWALPGN